MARDGSIMMTWGDGEYRFRLMIGQLRELQEKVDCGPYFLLNRIIKGEWLVDDLRETIRLGLIGAGQEPAKATVLVQRYVDARPIRESIAPARTILMAAIIGAPDGEQPGKRRAAKAQARSSPEESSPLPPSTGQEPSSDSTPSSSIN